LFFKNGNHTLHPGLIGEFLYSQGYWFFSLKAALFN
jgi:hypothetical protein